MSNTLPLGKLPAQLLAQLLAKTASNDPAILLGPGVGLDCAVLELGDTLLVLKSDPITFATAEIGWYLVQVNANDIATTGATPQWLMLTMLLPEGTTTPDSTRTLFQQVQSACDAIGVSIIGGHTEITHGIDRPIFIGTMIGTATHDTLITPQGAQPGDQLLLTKGVPIEATSILAREFADKLRPILGEAGLAEAQNYLYDPGISVLPEAKIAAQSGQVTAMHDPTEGGLLGALWELAVACGHSLIIDTSRVHMPALSQKICTTFNLDPLATIASGALLFSCRQDGVTAVLAEMENAGIPCTPIGYIEAGTATVWQETDKHRTPLPQPIRDEIAHLFAT